MGIEYYGRIYCNECEKFKYDKFIRFDTKYYCSNCITKLGGNNFKKAYKKLKIFLKNA